MLKLHKAISLEALEKIKGDREELLKYKKKWIDDGNEEVRKSFFNDGLKGIERIKAARELADLLIVRCAEDISNVDIAYYLYENPVIEYIEDFIFKVNMYINDDILDEDTIFNLAKELAFKCNTLEEVKLGLALLQLFDIQDYVDELMTLGLYNEYSYYVSRLFANSKGSNDNLFKLCKEASGTGKIHYLSALEPMSEEIVEWIVGKSLDDDAYGKLLWDLLLIKIDLDEISIEDSMNKSRFSSLSSIIVKIYLFYGFDNIQNFTTIIKNYLSYFERYADSFEEYVALKLIYKDLIDRRDEGIAFSSSSSGKLRVGELDALYIKAQRIYLKIDWGKELNKAIYSDDENSYLIFQIAVDMDDDLTVEEIKIILEKDPYEIVWYKYIEVLENTIYSNVLVKFVEENIDLNKVLCGPKNLSESQLTANEKEHFCLLSSIESMTVDCARENQDFLVAALSANLIETRKLALENLELIKEDWEEWVIDDIKLAIDSEINTIIQDKEMSLIYEKEGAKLERFLPMFENIEANEDDLFLMDIVVPSKVVRNYENSEMLFHEDKLTYLEWDDENKEIIVVSNFGVILGEVSKKDKTIIKNLLDGRETVYGRITNASEDMDFIYLKVFIKKEPLIVEISNALKQALT